MPRYFLFPAVVVSFSFSPAAMRSGAAETIRAGIIGLDTSHVIAFTKILNNPKATGPVADVKIVAGFPGGSPDIPSSANRVKEYTPEMSAMGVEIVDSIDTLLSKVDVVLLESVDGRPHLDQARPVIAAGKPLFIDKPAAGSLADVVAIFELAKRNKVPCFSSSSLRFSPDFQNVRTNPRIGKVLGCAAYSPCSLEPHHPDLFWYGVHGVELLYTIMGTGCDTVARIATDDVDLVTGLWSDGRVGTYRGIREGAKPYGAIVFGTKGVMPAGKYTNYEPLVVEIAKFFKTHKPPVAAEETIEIFAFMEAADESKRQGGRPVKIAEVLDKAKQQAAEKLAP